MEVPQFPKCCELSPLGYRFPFFLRFSTFRQLLSLLLEPCSLSNI